MPSHGGRHDRRHDHEHHTHQHPGTRDDPGIRDDDAEPAATTGSFATTQPWIEVTAPLGDRYSEILTPEALAFLAELHDRFAGIRHDLLAARLQTRVASANGRDPRFLPETASVRADATWRVAGAGPGLEDRRVEITGPTDRKMAINALNSGAKVWLADQEDATSPTWTNVIEGQLSLYDALRGELSYTSPDGKQYTVAGRIGLTHGGEAETPTIVMRPRGWHLVEKHLRFHDRSGRAMSASGSLVDFGLYFFHNARRLIELGLGPYFYLPKLESHREARLWNDVFSFSQEHLGIPQGTVRATVLIETIQAAFEMEEILYELRDHCAGPQRRALGLHLLDHQDVPLARAPLGLPRPLRDHDDGAVHEGVHRAARVDVPQARGICHRRHERVHPESSRPRGHRASPGEGRDGQAPRGR